MKNEYPYVAFFVSGVEMEVVNTETEYRWAIELILTGAYASKGSYIIRTIMKFEEEWRDIQIATCH